MPGGLRQPRRRDRHLHLLLRHVRRRLRRRGSRATAPTRCRPTGRTPRTRRSRRPSSTTRCGSRGSRWSRTPRARAGSAAGSACARTTSSTARRPYTILADRDRFGPWGAFGGHDGARRRVRPDPRRRETRLGSKVTSSSARRRDQRADCGGGGYGPPEERDPRRVLRDVLRGRRSAPSGAPCDASNMTASRGRTDAAGRRPTAGDTRDEPRGCDADDASTGSRVDIGGTFTDATLIDEETGRVAIAKVLSTPSDPSEGFMHAVERALADGGDRGGAGQLRLPRDDRRDERDHRGQDRAQRLRHDRRLPRPARDRAPGAADALRHAVREAARRSSRATARSGCVERLGPKGEVLLAARRRLGARGRRGAAARGGRVGRRLPPALVRQPGARAARRRDPRRGAARRARSRSRPRSRPSSASTCARRRP